ncbi:uncharacterized protein LOC113360568 [Papaver somniferum]|uniref:uncharacterized protein LOC113360568 n=1 Tax=Papaver somniferum TaxID=3469 RepID=UPI000E703906|nr:uncharacterized protein LOC113360568 [Papaver somniferum]
MSYVDIWKAGNDLIFNNTQLSVDICIHKSLEDFRNFDLHHALNYCSGIGVNHNTVAVWELPPSSFVKINVDDAFNNGKGDVAAVAVDSNGNHMGSGALCFNTFSSTVAEAKTYGFGIQLAKRLQLSRIIVEDDADEILKAIAGNTNAIP